MHESCKSAFLKTAGISDTDPYEPLSCEETILRVHLSVGKVPEADVVDRASFYSEAAQLLGRMVKPLLLAERLKSGTSSKEKRVIAKAVAHMNSITGKPAVGMHTASLTHPAIPPQDANTVMHDIIFQTFPLTSTRDYSEPVVMQLQKLQRKYRITYDYIATYYNREPIQTYKATRDHIAPTIRMGPRDIQRVFTDWSAIDVPFVARFIQAMRLCLEAKGMVFDEEEMAERAAHLRDLFDSKKERGR